MFEVTILKKKKMTKKEFDEKLDKLLQNPKLWEAIIQDEEYQLPDESECDGITLSEEL